MRRAQTPTGNAIHELLDPIALPWWCSMVELVERYGLTTTPGPDDLIDLGTKLGKAIAKPCEIALYECDV